MMRISQKYVNKGKRMLISLPGTGNLLSSTFFQLILGMTREA